MSVRDRIARRMVPRAIVVLSGVRVPRKVGAVLRRARGGSARVELFVAFDDPYSAVAALGLADRLAGRRAVLAIEPVVARGIPDDPAVDAKRAYALVDARRLARRDGRRLTRTTSPAPEATAFLARWAAAVPQGPARAGFCVAAMRHLWFASDGPIEPEPYARLWREHVGSEPPADDDAGAMQGSERRMRLRRLYDTPVAVVHGQWFFAHERLAQVEHRLDELGWTAGAAKGPNGARGPGAGPAAAPPAVTRPEAGAQRIEFFFSFRSPYSYLAAPRAFALAERYDVEVVFRGVMPMAMRGQSVPVAKRLHTLRDTKREADRLGMPFGRVHDPLGDGAIRCLLVAEHAADAGRVEAFVLEVSRAIWAQAADVAGDDGLRPVCERAGLRWEACAAALADPALRARVDANTQRLAELDHWGVPVFAFGDERFWGQDRIEDLEAALRDAGRAR
jgi:2-hydroxychromene-2-carboxylate isomerase